MQLSRYLVELDRPHDGWADLQDAVAGARAAAAAMRAEGVRIRFLRSVFVPEDDVCFFLYEAASRRAVTEAAQRSAAAVSRVSEVSKARLHGTRDGEADGAGPRPRRRHTAGRGRNEDA